MPSRTICVASYSSGDSESAVARAKSGFVRVPRRRSSHHRGRAAAYQDHQRRSDRRLHRLVTVCLRPPANGPRTARKAVGTARAAAGSKPARSGAGVRCCLGLRDPNWWLCRLDGRDVVWLGFDRFTGLPRAWREHGQGALDAGGKPPAIEDKRVHWHIGDVQYTLDVVTSIVARHTQWLLLFDRDIYEPTAFAWELLSPHLRPASCTSTKRWASTNDAS
jgi:hypothetical protein